MAELVAAFVIGSVFGGLIVAAWTSDYHRAWIKDGVIHFDGPLAAEDVAMLKEIWNREAASARLRVLP
jgi:hypothetical protein